MTGLSAAIVALATALGRQRAIKSQHNSGKLFYFFLAIATDLRHCDATRLREIILDSVLYNKFERI